MHNSRRDILRGLSLGAGAAAFTPFLKSLELQAAGNEAAMPKRFVFVIKSSGIDRHNLVPQGVTAKVGDRRTRDRFFKTTFKRNGLPEILKPFEKIKDKVTIIQGLSGQNFVGNHSSGHGLLSCHRSERTPVAPSVDYILGEKFSTGPYPMFGFSITQGAGLGGASIQDSYVNPCKSAIKKGLTVPYQASPEKAYMELFGSAAMGKKNVQQQMNLKKSMMDYLKDDAKRIVKHLGPDERERFESYTSALHALRVREEQKATMTAVIKKHAPEQTNKYNSRVETIRQEAHFDTATAALIAGLTNVVSFSLDSIGMRYTGLGITLTHLHDIGHGLRTNNGWDSKHARKMIDQWQLGLIAKMAHKLNGIKEGDGTMLDNTMIVYTSCAGGRHHNGQRDWPFVLIGGNQKLKMGQYLQYPSYQRKGHKTNANLFMSLMEAAGVDYGDHFGEIDGALRDLDLKGPLAALMA